MNFKAGQKVVCIAGGAWEHIGGKPGNYSGPQKDEICTISEIKTGFEIKTGYKFLTFKEHNTAFYDPAYFRSLQDNFAEETTKEIRIQQLEHRVEELERKLEEEEIQELT